MLFDAWEERMADYRNNASMHNGASRPEAAAHRGAHARSRVQEPQRFDREDALFSANLQSLQREPMLVSSHGHGGGRARGGRASLRWFALVAVVIVLVAVVAFVWIQRASGSSATTATEVQDAAQTEAVALVDDSQDVAATEVAPGESPDQAHGFADHRRRALGSAERDGAPHSMQADVMQVASFEGLVGTSAAVPELFQYPSMPAGCEVYSLVAVLNGLGIDADPDGIVANQLPFEAQDDDFATAFWGDPYSSGEGMPPAIMIAGNAVLEETGAAERFDNATGTAFDELAAKASSGSPVLVWTTLDFEDPQFDEPLEANSFYYLEHCVVLLGTLDGNVCLMDPTQGYVTVDYGWFKNLYEQCGSMALTLA